MATNDEIIGNEYGGVLCYSDVPAHLENGGYYISNGSCLLRYVPDVEHIKNMLAKARIDTAKQIFDKLEECQVDISRLRLSPEEAIDAIQREYIYWFCVYDADKVDALKKEFWVI